MSIEAMKIKAIGLPKTIEDYELALNAAFAGGKAAGQAIAEAEKQDCCGNPSQCWEPCGELGKSETHVKVYEAEKQEPVIDKAAAIRIATSLGWEPKRQPLPDEEIRKAKHHMVDGAYQYSFMQGVRYAEAAHGIKGEA